MSVMENLANGSPADDPQRLLDIDKAKLRRQRQARREVDAEENPPRPIPTPRTLKDRLANKTKAIPYRIADLMLYGHRGLLVAQFKAGKTTMIVNLIRALVDNRPFLNKYRVAAVVDVTLIDVEMASEDTNQLDEWYEKAGIVHQDRVKIVALRGAASSFNILDPEVRARWADNLRGTKFLILDCLRPILDALGLDENKDAGKFYVAFDALLKEAGIPEAFVVTHMGHTGERARGDSRNLDWPDVTWNLVRLARRQLDLPGSDN
jgi:RecA-family ATPase